VGHPLYDLVAVTKNRTDAAVGFGLDPSRKIVGLFPGSRRSEIRRLLPVIIAAACLLKKQYPELQFVLPLASTLREEEITAHLQTANLDVTITRERIHDLIRACDAVISVSGTVTLEIALIGTPMVVMYKVSPLTYLMAKRLVKVDHIALCNIVAGETIVRELIQDQANPQSIADEVGAILSDHAYSDSIKLRLDTVRAKLECGGASRNVAQLILSMMEQP
jgi:lipid-A-disaccharide synthase